MIFDRIRFKIYDRTLNFFSVNTKIRLFVLSFLSPIVNRLSNLAGN